MALCPRYTEWSGSSTSNASARRDGIDPSLAAQLRFKTATDVDSIDKLG